MKKTLVFGAAFLTLFACTKDKDGFSPEAIEKNQKEVYAKQFVDQYGTISENKTWDLTDFNASTRLGAADEITTQLVPGLKFEFNHSIKDGVLKKEIAENSINKAIYDYVKTALPDGKQHQGSPVVLTAPSNEFTIYPLSVQGAWTHDLYVKVGNEDPVKVYSKNWTDFSMAYVNGMPLKAAWTDWRHTDYIITEAANMMGLRVSAPVGTPIEIYVANVMEITTGSWGRTYYNPQNSSGTFNGRAIYVDANVKPEGIDVHPEAVIKYVGIEDCADGGDLDYNDVVLAVVGNPNVPEELKVEEDTYDVTSEISKRYMIEDLGSTGDFDFNDIVVDVYETTVNTFERTITNGVVTNNELKKTVKTQKAILRHLGGELPFELTIGNTALPERQGIVGQDLNEEFEVSGWDPFENNINVKVKALNSTVVFNIPFPKAGEAPMIIATPLTWDWMPERESVPTTWFYTDIK